MDSCMPSELMHLMTEYKIGSHLDSLRCLKFHWRCISISQALMSLFVLSCKDGWVNIMYDGLDAVGVDQQVCYFGRSY